MWNYLLASFAHVALLDIQGDFEGLRYHLCHYFLKLNEHKTHRIIVWISLLDEVNHGIVLKYQ
jgi:hypothetical protein